MGSGVAGDSIISPTSSKTNATGAEPRSAGSLFEDKVVKDTEYAVKDINPRNEYTYYVKAFRDDIVSAASDAVWVDGVAGLKVETEEATDVTGYRYAV